MLNVVLKRDAAPARPPPPQPQPPRRKRRPNGSVGNEGANKKKTTTKTKKNAAIIVQRGPLIIPSTPPRLPRCLLEKAHKRETLKDIAKRITPVVIVPYFSYQLRIAAQALGISVTTLKRLCRLHGITRWPHRQLNSIDRAVLHLEAKRRSSSDAVIIDQLRKLYDRRDIIIELAFSGEESPELAGDADTDIVSLDKHDGDGDDRIDSSSTRACTVHKPRPAPPQVSAESQGSPNTISPWWQHSPGTSPWQPGGGGNGGGGDDSDGGYGGGGSGSGSGGDGVGSAHVGMVGARETVGDKKEHGGGGGGAEGGGRAVSVECVTSFRAPPTLVRCPERSLPRAELTQRATNTTVEAMEGTTRHAPGGGSTSPQHAAEPARVSASPQKLPLSGYMLDGCRGNMPTGAAIPVAAAAAVAAAVAVACAANKDPTRPPSPATVTRNPVGTALAPLLDNREGGLKQRSSLIPPTHFRSLLARHPNSSIDEQIAELAALNDILFGPEPEDPYPVAATRARATAAVEAVVQSSKGVDTAPLEPPGDRDGRGVHGSGNAVAGRLPPFTQLAAAGALLNREQPGSCCRPRSLHVAERRRHMTPPPLPFPDMFCTGQQKERELKKERM